MTRSEDQLPGGYGAAPQSARAEVKTPGHSSTTPITPAAPVRRARSPLFSSRALFRLRHRVVIGSLVPGAPSLEIELPALNPFAERELLALYGPVSAPREVAPLEVQRPVDRHVPPPVRMAKRKPGAVSPEELRGVLSALLGEEGGDE